MKNFKDIRIIFLGTPEFAVASLDALVQAGCNIAAVVTAPDKPAGRGMQLQQSAVKKYAIDHQLTVLQPEKLKDKNFLEQLLSLKADVQVVVAFRMLPELVWNMPPMGTINVHASLLPQYRGAAPINWAVINGEKETGVTTFKLKHEIDTGNILLQQKLSIGDNETAGGLHDRMKIAGAELLVKTIMSLSDNSLAEAPQVINPEQQKHAPKIFTETCRISWEKKCDEIFNLIRGLSPYPGAFSFLNDKMLKIFKAEKEITKHELQTGTIQSDGKTFLKFACADGFIHCKEIQPEGKKKMAVDDFLRGWRG